MTRSSPGDADRTALLFAPTAEQSGRLDWREPDRGEQERCERLRLLSRWGRPIGWTAIIVGAGAFVVSATHPVSFVLYAVAVAGLGLSFASSISGHRLMWLNATVGSPVPGDVAEDAAQTQLQLLLLEEEINFWSSRRGARALRRRVRRHMLSYADALDALRTAWLRDRGEWQQVSERLRALQVDVDELSRKVIELPIGD